MKHLTTEALSDLYNENAVNHQVANKPFQMAISQIFADEFAHADMVCIPENIFEDGTGPFQNGRICGFFKIIEEDKIVFQRGYWDKLSSHRLYNSFPRCDSRS